ncbi:hypothetical protein PIB30_009525 [Stylosanthes scabra]|uniref:HMA domain-containing protein n=2 Tax=Stylosanthes scabra TaxID=79078 RepID=A0ABU6Z3X7_9FABA|nr:hypothetical protein [Stylosanthes scabra]
MGEEAKKVEETKVEETKAEEPKKEEGEKKPEESKDDKPAEEAPAPPPEIVLKVFMHCEGCARKVRRSLRGFPGVEDVITDCKSHKVVVKGEKADPLKVRERVQRKSHRQVELLSPIPKPDALEEEKKPEEKVDPKPEEKKQEPEVIRVVLQAHMHCEACAQEIKRRIERMKGVEAVEPDLKNSQVSVKGVFEVANLVDYVYKRTGKQVVVVKQETVENKEESNKDGKEEKKGEEGGDKDKKEGTQGEENKEKKEEGGGGGTEESNKVVELKKNEYYYMPPRYGYGGGGGNMEYYAAYPGPGYPPQIFSDENPNACTVM